MLSTTACEKHKILLFQHQCDFLDFFWSVILLPYENNVNIKWGTHLFVAVKSLQPHNVQSEYGRIQGTELVDVYEVVYKAGMGVC